MARAARLLTAALAGLLLTTTAACGSSGSSGETGAAVSGVKVYDDDGYKGIGIKPAYAVPPVTLTDTTGQPFDLATQTKRTLVFFGYTNCPDICQIVMSTIASSVARLSAAEQAELQVVFVTTDPARDTTKVLRTYLDRYNPRFIGVTGSLRQISALGKPMGIDVMKGQKLPSGGYEVQHTTNVIAVKGGRGDVVWTASTSPADLATDLHKILRTD